MTSEMVHAGNRQTVSLYSQHVYKDNVWVETCVRMNFGGYSDVLQTLVIIRGTTVFLTNPYRLV